jgi:hypothetical protein
METRLLAILTILALGGFGCSMSSGADSAGSSTGPSCPGCGNSAGAGNAGASNLSVSIIKASDVDAGTSWSPLCGPQSAGCLPDPDAGACNDLPVPSAGMDSSTDGGMQGDSGTTMDQGLKLTCRIRTVADSYAIERACEGAGKGNSGDPCLSPVDCGSGLTCVIEGLAVLCRPYCCADPESCPSNSYCTTRTTQVNRDPFVAGPNVPVCSVADNCPLSDPYPCSQNQNCTCPSGKACMVVRMHGLTACTKPGSGTQGEYCPCAAGFVCSDTTFTCLRLCQPGNSNTPTAATSQSTTCDAGTSCQASNDVPSGWGVCSDVPMLIN